MPNGLWNKADHYRQLVDECVALAKAATSNEIRAEHSATAEYYLHLADVEANLAGQFGTGLASLGQGGASWPEDASLDHLVGAGEKWLPSNTIVLENLLPIAFPDNYSILFKKLRKRLG